MIEHLLLQLRQYGVVSLIALIGNILVQLVLIAGYLLIRTKGERLNFIVSISLILLTVEVYALYLRG